MQIGFMKKNKADVLNITAIGNYGEAENYQTVDSI